MSFQTNISKSLKQDPHPILYMVSLTGKRKEQMMEADEVKLDVAKDSGNLFIYLFILGRKNKIVIFIKELK